MKYQQYESAAGFLPIIERHYREAKCGVHRHTVCPRFGGGACSTHVDRWNPDCDGQLGPHMRDDFWPVYGKPIIAIGVGLLAVFALSRL
jgi:hypothetical protein